MASRHNLIDCAKLLIEEMRPPQSLTDEALIKKVSQILLDFSTEEYNGKPISGRDDLDLFRPSPYKLNDFAKDQINRLNERLKTDK